jgi:membrane associated rhomboid family serine protease
MEKTDTAHSRLSLLAAGLLTAAIALTGALAGWAQNAPAHSSGAIQALMWQRDHIADRPWTLLSMHLVHGSASHALGNLMVMWIVVWATTRHGTVLPSGMRQRLGWRGAAMAGSVLALAAALTSGALWIWPAVQWGFGLSGALHILLVWLALDWLLASPPHSPADSPAHSEHHAGSAPAMRRRPAAGPVGVPARWLGALLLGGLVMRLAWEAAWLHPLKTPPDGGMAVLTALHVSGAGAGLITWPLRQRWRRQTVMAK